MVMSYDAMIAPDNAVRLIDLGSKKYFMSKRLTINRRATKTKAGKA